MTDIWTKSPTASTDYTKIQGRTSPFEVGWFKLNWFEFGWFEGWSALQDIWTIVPSAISIWTTAATATSTWATAATATIRLQ